MIIHQYDGEFFLLFFYLTFGFSMKFSKFRQSRICNLLFVFFISTLICNWCSVLLTYIVLTIQIEGVSDTDIYNHFYLIKLLVVLMWQIICILSLMCIWHDTFSYIQSFLFYKIIASLDVSEHFYRFWCLWQWFRLKVSDTKQIGCIQPLLFYQIITSFDVSDHLCCIGCLFQCFRLKV